MSINKEARRAKHQIEALGSISGHTPHKLPAAAE